VLPLKIAVDAYIVTYYWKNVNLLPAVISFSASAAKSELFNYFGKNRGTIEASKELVKPQNGVFRKVSGKEEIAMDFERVNIKGGSAYENVAG